MQSFPSGLERTLLRRAFSTSPRLLCRARATRLPSAPPLTRAGVLTAPPPAPTRVRNGLAPWRPGLMCSGPRANRLLPSSAPWRGRSAPRLKASRRPHIFLRFLLQWKPKPTITAYSNLAQWGEKGVRGGEGEPSPPPKHPEAVTYGGYAASLLQRSSPKGAGASCPPTPARSGSSLEAVLEPGPWPRSAAHSPEAAMLGEGERTQRTRMRQSRDYSGRDGLGDAKPGGGGELRTEAEGGAALGS